MSTILHLLELLSPRKKYAYRLKLEARLATYQDGLSLKTNFQLRNPPLDGAITVVIR